MKNFRRTNLILTAVLLILSCSVAFAQEKDTTGQKKQVDSKKNQEQTFDASNATLEETQNWLKKNLVKYGKFGNSFVENVKFKECELSYSRSLNSSFYDSYERYQTAKPVTMQGPTERGKNIESMTATDFRNLFPDYSDSISKTKVNLTNLDAERVEVINNGKVFLIRGFLRKDAAKDEIEVEKTKRLQPAHIRDKTPILSNSNKNKTVTFIVNNDRVANQVKDALIRLITLCQQKQ